jgi:hypothetical protein
MSPGIGLGRIQPNSKPLRRDMSFKRPYWLLLYVSPGFLALCFADLMFVTPDFKGAPDLRLWIFIAGPFLGLFGAVGFLSSLLWMMVAGISSGIHSTRPKP